MRECSSCRLSKWTILAKLPESACRELHADLVLSFGMLQSNIQSMYDRVLSIHGDGSSSSSSRHKNSERDHCNCISRSHDEVVPRHRITSRLSSSHHHRTRPSSLEAQLARAKEADSPGNILTGWTYGPHNLDSTFSCIVKSSVYLLSNKHPGCDSILYKAPACQFMQLARYISGHTDSKCGLSSSDISNC